MPDTFPILFSSAGRRVELIECFRADARELGIDLRVLAADLKPDWSSACAAADKAVAVPRCTDSEFVPEMLKICEREKVRLVIPTIDTELQVLADNRSRFEKLGTRVAVSASNVVRVARDKALTAEFLSKNGIVVPRTDLLGDMLAQPEIWRWPLILKPIGGSSSVGIQVVTSIEEARAAAGKRSDYLAQELWKGSEYTVNVFFDQFGKLRSAIPHLRYETRTGEVSKGITEKNTALLAIAERLGNALGGAYGALCFQAIVTQLGEVAVFEINARFGGGYPIAHRAGAKFSKWLLEEAAGLPCSANPEWEEGIVMLRYDAACFKKQPKL